MDAPTPPSVAAGLPDMEISYLKLLKSLRAAGQYGTSDLPVVRRIATWIDSEPVLHYICLNRRWYDDWEVKEALVRNERTPRELHGALETQVAIFDLLREMDSSDLAEDERREMREDVRSLIKTLEDADRQVVRQRAYQLSSSRRDGDDSQVSPPPPPAPSERPAEPEISPEIEAQLEAQVREEAQRRREEAEALFGEDFLSGEHAPGAAPGADPAQAGAAEAPPLDAAAKQVAAQQAAEQPSVEPEVPAAASEPMGSATVELLRSELGDLPSLPPLKSKTEESKAEELKADSLKADLLKAEESKAQEPKTVDAPEKPAEPAVPESQRELELARTGEDTQLLQVLAGGHREEVLLALLENPILPESAAVLIARKATPRVAEALYRQRRLFQRPRVQQALLKSPSAPSAALLEIVNSVGDLRGLLTIVSSPRVRHMEVKAKARSRLGNVFRAMSQGEKVAAVRRSGRPLLKQLWSDFFRDEPLVMRCLKEKQLDEGTVLEISRSKIAPRRALEVIGNTAMWTANYQVRLALVSNPKTPRQVATRLVRKLSPADRRMIKRNPAVAEAIRRMA
ncbi:MAG: hypothetical protein AAGD01_06165 [Acidobacteriota bacterium]